MARYDYFDALEEVYNKAVPRADVDYATGYVNTLTVDEVLDILSRFRHYIPSNI